MSIFRKASENVDLPKFVRDAYFDNNEISIADEFEGLLKEASSNSNRSIYENRLKEFNKKQGQKHNFDQPAPARYSELEGGIRRAGYGQRFQGEQSEIFGKEDHIRTTFSQDEHYAENALHNGFSIWEPEFDDLESAFKKSQSVHDAAFDRRTAAEKRMNNKTAWEQEQLGAIRKSNILPHRGMGVARSGNEMPINHGKFGSVNEFYAEAQDNIRELIRESNRDRKTKISRNGSSPEESQEIGKEIIQARTLQALQNNSEFLRNFAEVIALDDN